MRGIFYLLFIIQFLLIVGVAGAPPDYSNPAISNTQPPNSSTFYQSQTPAFNCTVDQLCNCNFLLNGSSVEWDNSTLSPEYAYTDAVLGTHSIEVIAYNATNSSYFSSYLWSFTIVEDEEAPGYSNPMISNTQPPNSSTFYQSQTPAFYCTVDQLCNCNFILNGSSVEWDNSTLSPSFIYTDAVLGTHQIEIIAYNASNSSYFSSYLWSFTIVEDDGAIRSDLIYPIIFIIFVLLLIDYFNYTLPLMIISILSIPVSILFTYQVHAGLYQFIFSTDITVFDTTGINIIISLCMWSMPFVAIMKTYYLKKFISKEENEEIIDF